MAPDTSFDPAACRIGIAGVGLIGGSLALALRASAWRGAPRLGYDPAPGVLERACRDGVLDGAAASLPELADHCDLLVLCQPMPQVIEALPAVARAGRLPVICDVASVKLPVVRAAAAALGARRSRFVAAHPIAGKAQRGLEAADAQLFRDRPVVLCPEHSDPEAAARVAALWQATGARLETMSAAEHDVLYASLSHLPQVLTWAYLLSLGREPSAPEMLRFAGPGFESFTRLGGSDPSLWTDIVIENRLPLLERLERFGEGLDALRRALRRGRREEVRLLFDAARGALLPAVD